MNILLDTNVILEYFAVREKFPIILLILSLA